MGREDPLEKEMATHSGVLAWRIPWTEDIGGLQFMGPKDLDTIVQLLLSLFHDFLAITHAAKFL